MRVARLPLPYGLVTRKEENVEHKIGIKVPQCTCKWDANFQLKRSKFKVTGHEKPPHQSGVMFSCGRQIKRRLISDKFSDGQLTKRI